MRLIFERDNGLWFFVAPDWPGLRSSLQMVAGADDLIEWMSRGSDLVKVDVFLSAKQDFDLATATSTRGDYITDDGRSFWLCPVAQWFFGFYPKHFWFRPIYD